MAGHPRMQSHAIDDFRRDLQRLNGAKPQALQSRNAIEDRIEELKKRTLRVEIPTVAAEMNSGKHDLFVSALRQARHFLYHRCRCKTAASAANGRNDAKRTIRVATILN